MSIKKQKESEEEALQEALSPIVNRLIDKNFEKSGDKIASQMAPLIGGAIREQIKSQKDDIVDALYPVMGNMISKFVTKSLEELFNKINQQIQNGLSVATLKRKIKAKIKGVSETELLLEENATAKIKAALLIHKESGMLLAKAEDETASLSDTDMLASMMTAIRSFVNEWIASNETHQELGEIEYGGNKIIIEASGYTYLAVIVEGAAFHKTYEKIRHTLENIVLEHSNEIQNFQGDFSLLDTNAIEKKLQKLIMDDQKSKEEDKQEETKKHPLLYIIPLLLLLFFIYQSYITYRDNQLQEVIQEKILQTAVLAPFYIKADVQKEHVTLHGKVPFAYHKQLALSTVQSVVQKDYIIDKIVVIPTLSDPMQVSAQIAYLIKGFNLSRDANIGYNFDYNQLLVSLYGTVGSLQQKEELLKAIKQIDGVNRLKESIELAQITLDEYIYFPRASSKLTQNAKENLLTIVERLKSIDANTIVLHLRAYSDLIGSKTTNERLSQKRLETIDNFFQIHLPNKQLLFQKETLYKAPPGVDPKKNPDAARCVRISLPTQKES